MVSFRSLPARWAFWALIFATSAGTSDEPGTSVGPPTPGSGRSLLERLTGRDAPPKPVPEDPESGSADSVHGGAFGWKKLWRNDRVRDLVDTVNDAVADGRSELGEWLEANEDASAKFEEALAWMDRKVAGREATFTGDEIRRHAETLVPLVEDVNARAFARPPEVKAVGNLQMVHILAQDLVPQFESRLPDLPRPMLYLRAYLGAAIYTPCLLGKYGTRDHVVYVLPQNISTIVAGTGIDPDREEDIVRIVIAHELTHALQDQEIGLLESILKPRSPDEAYAFNALIEGHAVYMQNEVARRLGLDEAASDASALVVAGDLEEDAWVFERLAHTSSVQMEQTYLGGERFVAHHAARGGVENIWTLLGAPPRRSSMITRPETYTPEPPALPDYAAAFRFSLEDLGLPGWSQEASHLGDFDLRGHLASVPSEQRERVLRDLLQSVTIVLADEKDIWKTLEISLFELRSEAGATLLVESIDRLGKLERAALEQNPAVRLVSHEDISFPEGDYHIASATQYTTDAILIGETSTTSVLVRQGNRVAHIIDSESGLSQDRLTSLLRDALQRLNHL